MNCIIWDLDNCLADDRHRIPLIDHRDVRSTRWDAYHAACSQDPPGRIDTFLALRTIAPDCANIIITGRPEAHRTATTEWLCKTVGWHPAGNNALFMRAPRDERDAVAIKRGVAEYLKRRGFFPRLAFDDRPDIVDMYRELGIPGVVLAVHDDQSPHGARAISAGRADDWADVDTLAQLRPDSAKAAPQGFSEASFAVGDILADAARTFASRNAAYGAAYEDFGAVLAAAWPSGLRVEGAEQFGRLALMVLGLGKWHRYARSFETGHIDSARDAAVYAAMLEQLTRRAHGEPAAVPRG